MKDRFFLDTNVFVYSFDRTTAAKSKVASELIRTAVSTRKGVVSYQVVQEFFNVALKRFAKPLNVYEARRYLGTVFHPLLSIHSSEALYSSALQLYSEERLAWYDALIVAAALEGECDVLFSEDLQHGRQLGGLQIRNPFL